MSTKCTIRHGKRWHLYNECLEDDAVYLNLEDVEFNVSASNDNTNITICVDNKLALEIGLISEEEKLDKTDWIKDIKAFKLNTDK